MNDLERKCHNFILQCYFGDMENPIDAAIDRAYVDMASHTLKGFAEHQYQEKWELRFEASSKIISSVLTALSGNLIFISTSNDIPVFLSV